MPARFRAAAAVLSVAGTALLLVPPGPAVAEETKPADAKVTYSKDVQPLLAEKCGRCHGDKKPRKGINLTSYDAAMKTVKADKPDESRLYKSLVGQGAKQMPPKKPLSDDEIAKVKAWIAAGAKNN